MFQNWGLLFDYRRALADQRTSFSFLSEGDWMLESESESYITTDGQSVSLSFNKAPIWGLRSVFCYGQLRGCWYGALFLTKGRVCSLLLLLALASAVIFGSKSRGTRDYILLSQIRDFPFCRLLRLAGLRWRYSTPASTREDWMFSESELELL
jgi:hypothetical protein